MPVQFTRLNDRGNTFVQPRNQRRGKRLGHIGPSCEIQREAHMGRYDPPCADLAATNLIEEKTQGSDCENAIAPDQGALCVNRFDLMADIERKAALVRKRLQKAAKT